MLRIIGTISLSGELFDDFVGAAPVDPRVISTSGIVRVSPADEECIVGHFGKNSDIVIAVINTFAFHQTQLSVAGPWGPRDPKVLVLREVGQTYVVDHVSRTDKERSAVLLKKLEVVGMCLISQKSQNLI